MANSIIQMLVSGVLDTDGTPLASGKVYHYSAGTLTTKNMYTDYAGSTPAAQPIVLDSRGCATVYGSGLYKVIIKDSDDATVVTIDNFTATSGGPTTALTTVTATANGQSVFTVPSYTVGDGSLRVYLEGARLTDYTETNTTTITLGTATAAAVVVGTQLQVEVD
jgi:hypothetical protein